MFGNAPFDEPALVLTGALLFALLFEGAWILGDFVVSGRFVFGLEAIAFFFVAFLGYLAVAIINRGRSGRGRKSDRG